MWQQHLFLSCIFCHTKQKNVLQKEIKEWAFEGYLLTARLFINSVSSWFWLNESLKMTCTRSNAWYLDFLSNGERLDYFSLPNVLPTLCKITESVSKNEQVKMINFELSKYTKMNINFELFKISKMSSLEIYISPVTEMLQASNLWYINFVCVFYITFGCYL